MNHLSEPNNFELFKDPCSFLRYGSNVVGTSCIRGSHVMSRYNHNARVVSKEFSGREYYLLSFVAYNGVLLLCFHWIDRV